MSRGEPLPDAIMVNVIFERLRQTDCLERGWLLEGFPRTGNQAVAMKTAGSFLFYFMKVVVVLLLLIIIIIVYNSLIRILNDDFAYRN